MLAGAGRGRRRVRAQGAASPLLPCRGAGRGRTPRLSGRRRLAAAAGMREGRGACGVHDAATGPAPRRARCRPEQFARQAGQDFRAACGAAGRREGRPDRVCALRGPRPGRMRGPMRDGGLWPRPVLLVVRAIAPAAGRAATRLPGAPPPPLSWRRGKAVGRWRRTLCAPPPSAYVAWQRPDPASWPPPAPTLSAESTAGPDLLRAGRAEHRRPLLRIAQARASRRGYHGGSNPHGC